MAADEYETPEELARMEEEINKSGILCPEGTKPVDLKAQEAKNRATRHEIDSQGGLVAALENLLRQPALPIRREK